MFVDMLARNRGAGGLDESLGARPANAARAHQRPLPAATKVPLSHASPGNLPAGVSAWGLSQKGAMIRFTSWALEEIEE
jgi:hypothetical protein